MFQLSDDAFVGFSPADVIFFRIVLGRCEDEGSGGRKEVTGGVSVNGIDASRLLPIISVSVRLNACQNRSLTASMRCGGCVALRLTPHSGSDS